MSDQPCELYNGAQQVDELDAMSLDELKAELGKLGIERIRDWNLYYCDEGQYHIARYIIRFVRFNDKNPFSRAFSREYSTSETLENGQPKPRPCEFLGDWSDQPQTEK